jgi:hypothetical protein
VGTAFAVGVVAWVVARHEEVPTSRALAAAGAIGLAAQSLRAWLAREHVVRPAATPYR